MTVIISPQGPSPAINKSPNEQVFILFDFTPWMLGGDTIASAVVTASNPLNPADTVPAAMVSGAASVIGGVTVQQKFIGGTLGTSYLLQCLATSVSGQKFELSALMFIEVIYGVVT